MKLHMDGARLFNAVVASNQEPSTICKYVDSVTVCLSKVKLQINPFSIKKFKRIKKSGLRCSYRNSTRWLTRFYSKVLKV